MPNIKRSVKLNNDVDLQIEKAKLFFLQRNIKLTKGDVIRLAMTVFTTRLKNESIEHEKN
ncbi:hypothetical protein C1N53_11230 [Pontibacter sp. SGAir0037]|nr:hypothetical protein C1N53_11230 [Pontibacter sp. SGAir0037]